jgi:feruloyl esterase
MGGAVSNYGFAAASTNTGHESSDLVGTFAANNPQSQIDFGYRAVHLSTIFSKNVVRAFYGSKAKKFRSYWLGCSSGGKQGLKEAQMYPDDYDGILAGSPAWWWDHLMAWGLYGGLLNPEGPGHLNTTDFSALHEAIIAQCDALDGLTDGIVTNPALCKVDWAKTGLSPAQQKQVAVYYEDWISSTGELLFPGYSPGAEELGLTSAGGSIIEFAPDYYRYQVLNYTNITAAANVNFTDVHQLEKLVNVADKTNPGGLVADNYDISPFFHRGGKLLHYGGTQDQLIDWGSVRTDVRSVILADATAVCALSQQNPPNAWGRLPCLPLVRSTRDGPVRWKISCRVVFADLVLLASSCGGGSRAPNVFGGDTGASGSKPSNMKPSNVCLCS